MTAHCPETMTLYHHDRMLNDNMLSYQDFYCPVRMAAHCSNRMKAHYLTGLHHCILTEQQCIVITGWPSIVLIRMTTDCHDGMMGDSTLLFLDFHCPVRMTAPWSNRMIAHCPNRTTVQCHHRTTAHCHDRMALHCALILAVVLFRHCHFATALAL